MYGTSRTEHKGRERMESVRVLNFLTVSSGSSSGSGDGSGYGDGDGSGDGSGYGSGYGSGSGLKNYCGKDIHIVDGVQTIIEHVHGNVAKGNILQSDLSTTPCFLVKHQNLFAHGTTLKEAGEALEAKIFDTIDVNEKISMFLSRFKPGVKYAASEFYDWHHRLTGSCKAGRDAFVTDHNIDLKTSEYTVAEFIAITENAYGGEIVRRLKSQAP